METIEELQGFLATATLDGVWGQLLDRGTAWSIMRHDGQLPEDAPPLGETIATDLAEYGFAVLRASLALKEAGGDAEICQSGFEKAANAFEALVRNGAPEAIERGFYRIIAGASYHLAGYSAIAYSLFSERGVDSNVAPAEEAFGRLVLRDLDALRTLTREWLLNEEHSDDTLAEELESGAFDDEDAVAVILNSAINRALAYFDFALQTGDASLVDTAKEVLTTGLTARGRSRNSENPPP